MLRLLPTAMRRLFQPTLDGIKQAIGIVLNNPAVKGKKTRLASESVLLIIRVRSKSGI
jgi:hypothetical protein